MTKSRPQNCVCSDVGRDRLSEMPDEIIINILSCMPTIDAVRTVLLRRFGNLWTFVHSLKFYMDEYLAIFQDDSPISDMDDDYYDSSLSDMDDYYDSPISDMDDYYPRTSKPLPDLTKLEKLDGHNYKRWSQKLLMFFEQLEIDYVLFSDPPAPVKEAAVTETVENTPPAKSVVKLNEEDIKKFDKDNKLVRCQLLNNMTDTLFDLFMMADGKPIMEQVHVYENLCADVVNEGMKLDDIFVANVLLEKFPPSWSDYRNHLKHKKKDLSLQELVGHMRTEEANRLKDKPVTQSVKTSVAAVNANLVESGCPSYTEKFKGKGISVFDKGLFAEFEEVADGECVYMAYIDLDRIKHLRPCVTSQLKTITLHGYLKSWRKSWTSQLQLIEFLLKTAATLDKLVIVPVKSLKKADEVEFVNHVSIFEMSSPTVRVIFA
ncbi:uncharacterized protein LOC141594721 [Silene latifolia]|uniref:uncharacterized protein LOC141594721 n=1 Tax=Silene latifolia TaxID=37657 RepID=UPI003D78A9B1